MANTIITENLLQKETIKLKDKLTIIKQAANTKYQGELRQSGDTVTIQQFNDTFGNIGGTAGSTISTPDWAIQSFNLVVDKVYQNGRKVLNIEEVQSNLQLRNKLSNRFAYGSALNEDQFVASFATSANANNKLQDQNPLTLTSSNTYSSVTSLTRVLSANNAFSSRMLFVSPAIHEKFRLENILNSTEGGLNMRLNGEVGRLDGFKVLETNNLPHVRTLTLDTQVTATDTMTVVGKTPQSSGGFADTSVVFTFVAAASAAVAGDISIGANLAACQQNVIDAINGTGTAGASTYVEISAADRTALQNGLVAAETAFVTNNLTIQSAADLQATETFTTGTNIFNADAVLMFAVDNEAINFVSQMDRFKIKDLTDAFAANILQEKVYGGAVVGENAKGLATIEIFT